MFPTFMCPTFPEGVAVAWTTMTWRPLADPDGPPPRRVADSLDPLLRRLGGGSAVATAKVFAGWESAVGAAVAAHARPVALRGTTLVVGVDAPAYATQLRMMTPQLLARLAELVGPTAVDGVEVRVRG